MTWNRWLLLLAMLCTPGCALTSGAGAAAAPAAAAPTSATAGATTIVAVQPAAAPASPPCTIWQFLGVPGIAKGACGIISCVQNRLGTLFPGLEAKPPLLAITDPANAQSSNPAVSAAAGAKADEDAAPQKVKAINYLGTIGCGGCYPEVQDALLAALDDCTEAVRFAAVNALRGTACGQCKVCRKKSCCSPKVMEKLYKVANDVDDTGCYKEPSPRVRRMARLAMAACGGGVPA
ncbi:MAG TPA: HEAT repeat domain-containing protein, partial [Pirellulales bacterium]|nr:HEAT repeat domain-containing protein [Pirellulales bacterium]